jgi:hypothetical protein
VDIDHLPRIPDDGAFVTPLRFTPRACGPTTLFVEAKALDGSAAAATGAITVDVTVDPVDATQSLLNFVVGRHLDRTIARKLTSRLRVAKNAFRWGRKDRALRHLDLFMSQVTAQSGLKVDSDLADALMDGAFEIEDCLSFAAH